MGLSDYYTNEKHFMQSLYLLNCAEQILPENKNDK